MFCVEMVTFTFYWICRYNVTNPLHSLIGTLGVCVLTFPSVSKTEPCKWRYQELTTIYQTDFIMHGVMTVRWIYDFIVYSMSYPYFTMVTTFIAYIVKVKNCVTRKIHNLVSDDNISFNLLNFNATEKWLCLFFLV